MPTETNVHGDALCFMVMRPSLLQRLAVGGGWRLAVVGSWRLVAVGGHWGLPLRAVLNKRNKQSGFLRAALPAPHLPSSFEQHAADFHALLLLAACR